MTYEELRNLVVFCKQEGLMLMADEVWCLVCVRMRVCVVLIASAIGAPVHPGEVEGSS